VAPIGKVVILAASAGGGHVAAARALEQAMGELGIANEVKVIDALEHTTALFRKVYAQAYLDLVDHAPGLLGWLYDTLDKPWKNEKRRLAVDRLNSLRLVKLLEKEKPDVAVSTHFLPSEILSWMKGRGCLACPQAVVVTDFDVHAMWLARNVERWFVALEETRVHLSQLGVPAENVRVTGIPVKPAFAQKKSRAAMRTKHGLDADRPVVLVAAGGFGVGPVEKIVQVLLSSELPLQIVALCGKGEELRRKLERLAEKSPGGRARLRAVGFTTEMDEWMAAADLLVSKSGGLTTSEAMASALPMVVVNPIPGQEERNSDHLLERGAAVRCNNLPTLAWKVDSLLSDRKRLAAMRAAAEALGRPRAAYDVAQEVARMFTNGRRAPDPS